MGYRGKKRRRRRRVRGTAAGRVMREGSVGGIALGILMTEGLLHRSTESAAAGPRVRATTAERAHVDRLRADPDTAARPLRLAEDR